MKTFLIIALSIIASAVTRADTLTVGTVTYSNVTFGAVTPATVTIRHSTGIERIPLWKLTPELQTRFHYNPTNATVYAQREAVAVRAQQERDLAAARRAQQPAAAPPPQTVSAPVSDAVQREYLRRSMDAAAYGSYLQTQ